jgi:hypothetical protein
VLVCFSSSNGLEGEVFLKSRAAQSNARAFHLDPECFPSAVVMLVIPGLCGCSRILTAEL